MAAVNPAALIRRSRTEKIANVLRRNEIPDVGQFGTSGSLPTDPGPVDPPILTGGNYPAPTPSPSPVPVTPNVSMSDIWTHYDPGFGTQQPSVEISGADSVTGEPNPAPSGPQSNARSWLSRIFNPFGGGQSWQRNAASNHPQTPAGPAWYQPGYQLPAGIQNAINRGDYTNAYGQSPMSASNNFQMWDQSRHQPVNMAGGMGPVTSDPGHTFFQNPGTTMRGTMEDGMITAKPSTGLMDMLKAKYAASRRDLNGQPMPMPSATVATPNLYADAAGNAQAGNVNPAPWAWGNAAAGAMGGNVLPAPSGPGATLGSTQYGAAPVNAAMNAQAGIVQQPPLPTAPAMGVTGQAPVMGPNPASVPPAIARAITARRLGRLA